MDLAEVQTKLLVLLETFDSLCRKNDLKYSLHAGTLLGAIREKNFIPWDDDADVAMSRSEFQKLEILLKNNPNFYIRGAIKKQFCMQTISSVWIDIFVCDYITCGLLSKVKLGILTILDVMSRNRETIKLSDLSKYGIIKRFVFKTIFCIGQLIPQKIKTDLYWQTAEKIFVGNRSVMFRSNDQLSARKLSFDKRWLESFVDVPFATANLMVSAEYKKLLESCYGENYMTPIKYVRNSCVHAVVRDAVNKEGSL